jgi:hypothetical protein
MNASLTRVSIPLLCWVLGLVVFEQSLQFAFSSSAAHFFLKTGLPPRLRPALGITEALAALLFLLPFTAMAGGYLLLVIFGLAAAIHILHGRFDVGGLLVYAAAALVCMAGARRAVDAPQEET